MIIERTDSPDIIYEIVTHDSIWPHVSEDGIDRDMWRPIIQDSVYNLLIIDESGIGGCFLFIPQSFVCWEVHTCILPSHRGQKAIQAARMAVDWMFSNTECQSIITRVPVFNKHAALLAANAGFKAIGLIELAWLKNGVAHNAELMGVAKCQQ